MSTPKRGLIFALDETATHDGPGLRMAVYLKGCPLSCLWCHSPESISPYPEIVWYENRCTHCAKCIEICPEGLRSTDPVDEKDRSTCRLCALCVEQCPSGALEVKGYHVTPLEILDHALQLRPFFERSKGGVTLTGGEPTLQFDFSYETLSLLQSDGIHTAVETCGYTKWHRLRRIAEATDLFLFDFKHPDERLHEKYTGVSNRPILSNLSRLVSSGADVVVRVPLIPGLNDSPEIVGRIGQKSLELGVERITLLPFNPASAGKYSWLHKSYPLSGEKRQGDEYVSRLENLLRGEGLSVVEA